MSTYQAPIPRKRVGPSAESTLLTLAILAGVIVLLSAVTLTPRKASTSTSNGSNSNGNSSQQAAADLQTVGGSGSDTGGGVADVGAFTTGDVAKFQSSLGAGQHLAKDASGNLVAVDQSGKVVGTVAKAGSGSGTGSSSGSGTSSGVAAGTRTGTGTGTGSSGGTGTGGTSGSGGGTGTGTGGGSASCGAGKNGGATDTGVTASAIKIGAVTVDSGPGATFLQPEDVAMKAETQQVNSHGGVCGRQLVLDLHDSGWDAPTGASDIENMIQADKVFVLAVNPDSEGLNAVSIAPYGNGKLDSLKVPVVGTDGLLFSQYQDPYIFPIAASTAAAMHSMAVSQYNNSSKGKSTKFSIVYEQTYRFGREGADAYNNEVRAKTGSNIDGYSDPNTNPKCQGSFCGVPSSSTSPSYGSQANTINACGCDVGAVLLEPATAIQWFKSGGGFGGVSPTNAHGGAGAAPQPLFQRFFADGCQQTCNGMRLWTGFLPPIGQFASQPAVAQYVNTMHSYSSSVDVNNQFAEGAYVGMLLLEKALTTASTASGGLTRDNVIAALNSTKDWSNGLTVSPLSWSSGNHFAENSVHAFDELYPSGFGGWQYVQGSQTADPSPGKI